MSKRLGFCALLTTISALMLGVFAFNVNENKEVKAVSEVDAQLFDVQMRSGGSDLNYLVLRDSLIDPLSSTMSISGRNYNAPDYVNVYLAPQGQAIKLATFIDTTKNWDMNLWTSGGIMFHINDEKYNTYNGATIYAIEVLEGCTYPNSNLDKSVVRKTVKYINGSYGNPNARNEAFSFALETERDTHFGDIEVSSIHNRMDSVSGYRWLMFLFSEEVFETSVNVTAWINELNFLDNVLIYFSEEGEPVALRTIYDSNTTGVAIQLFGQKNMMAVSISNENVDGKYLYAGPEMFRVTLPQGTQVPNMQGNVGGYYTVKKDVSFRNEDYGKYGEIPGDVDEFGNSRLYEEWSINFKVEAAGFERLGEVSVTTIHNRMDKDSGYRWIMIMFDENIYSVSLDVREWVRKLHFLDNIYIYLSENSEPLLLSEIYDPTTTTGVTIQLFGQKNMIAISISNEVEGDQYKYCGPNMYKVVIEDGTQFPTYENGVAGYREITEKAVLINNDYQMFGEIDDTMDDYGNPRIYEEWNINWALASCYVTFKVVGLDNVSYPDMLLDYGQRVPLSNFAVDGYDLVATTTLGDTIYECLIGTNHNLDVILTYSAHKNGGNKSGCGGSIVTGSTIIVAVSLIAVVLLINKRRGIKA